jgi:hypothetical protein
MKNNPSFKQEESAGLRCRLETCLSGIFTGQKIDQYLMFECNPTDAQTLSAGVEPVTALQQIKLAYAIWLAMHAADRHAVLTKFQHLYATVSNGDANRQTFTFCTVFIHEFASILAEAMQWPD